MALSTTGDPQHEEAIREIKSAYRFILGREADDGGLQTYYDLITNGRLDYHALRRIMLDSPEFAASMTPYAIVEMERGLKAVVDPTDPEFGRAIAVDRTWEAHIVDAIRRSLKSGDTFVDIGANVGIMSFNAAEAVGASGKVIGFEPNPRNVSAYRRGIAANGFSNVLLYPFALSDHRHMITVTSASNGKVEGEASPTQGADVIQAVTADEILRHEPRIDLIKIDIEGWELPALRGAEAILERTRPLVLCEFNPACLRDQGGIDAATLSDFIFRWADHVELVEHDMSRTRVSSSADLMELWHERDAYYSSRGELPPGWVHFDLLFRADRGA